MEARTIESRKGKIIKWNRDEREIEHEERNIKKRGEREEYIF